MRIRLSKLWPWARMEDKGKSQVPPNFLGRRIFLLVKKDSPIQAKYWAQVEPVSWIAEQELGMNPLGTMLNRVWRVRWMGLEDEPGFGPELVREQELLAWIRESEPGQG